MKNSQKGLAPILCESHSGIHHHHFACPICKNKVGGFYMVGNGENDWRTHQDKFCSECGQKIDWSNVEWGTIYCW